MKPRCAIVECYNRHDEVYLGTVHLLNRLGYHVELFTTLRNRTKNVFVYAAELDCTVHWRWRHADVLAAAAEGRHEFVVFNTFEGEAVLEAARRMIGATPIIGFLHNASFLRSRPAYGEFIEHRHCRFAVLAPYVRQCIADITDALCVTPVFFHDQPLPPRPARDGGLRFCVQGYFDSLRRPYGLLLEALRQLADEGRDGFDVLVMGRNFSPDFRAFHGEIERRGLAPRVRYAWKGIGYRAYYALLDRADFILPLVSPDSHRDYFETKATSSMAAAIGFAKIPVADARLAAYYGLEDASFTYTDDLASAMRAALAGGDAQRRARHERVARARQRWLDESAQQLRSAIAAFA
jgi:hypothetical protein